MRITLSNTEYERWRYFAQQWNKRSELPALRAVTYVNDGKNVYVRCTNLKYWLQKPIFTRASGKGICVVPTFYTVSDPTVELHQTKQALTLNGRAVNTNEYEPFALPVPLDKLVPRVRCYRTDLIHAIQFALPAMRSNPNDVRFHGVRIVGTKTALLAEATDTYRIHQKYIRATALTEPSELVVYATEDLVVLLNMLNGTTVSIGAYDETAYIITDKNEYIFWQHRLQFPNTARALPDPANQIARLRVSVHALRNACKSLGKLKKARQAKTYFELTPDNRLMLTCAETENTALVQLYSPPVEKPLEFALDRYFVLDLLNLLPSHATVDIGIYPYNNFVITDWQVVGNDSYYAAICGMTL